MIVISLFRNFIAKKIADDCICNFPGQKFYYLA